MEYYLLVEVMLPEPWAGLAHLSRCTLDEGNATVYHTDHPQWASSSLHIRKPCLSYVAIGDKVQEVPHGFDILNVE